MTDAELLETMKLLEELRQDEGCEIVLACSNPDFNGLPDEVVEFTADWTNWQPRRITGDSLRTILQEALQCRQNHRAQD